MTLDEAISYARARNPVLAADRARITAAASAADVPRAQWQPYVAATAQLFAGTDNNSSAVSLADNFVDLPRTGGTPAITSLGAAPWNPYMSTLAAVGVRQEVFDFGRISAQTAAADALIDVARQRSNEAWLVVRYGVEEAYDAVFAARSVLNTAEETYARSRIHRDLARAWVTQGLRSRIELDRAEADLARYDSARIRARGGVETAQAVFAATVGYPSPRLDVAGEVPQTEPLPALDDALRQAAARDPRILEVISRLRAQEAQTRAIDAETRPNLQATGSVSGRAGGAPTGTAGDVIAGSGLLPAVPNWDLGVVFDWPLYDATVRARATASRQTEAVVRQEIDAVRLSEVGAIEDAWVATRVALDALPSLERAVQASRSNYEQADARFRQGLGSSVELADAEALRADAEIQLALGRFQIARSRAQLARAIAEGM